MQKSFPFSALAAAAVLAAACTVSLTQTPPAAAPPAKPAAPAVGTAVSPAATYGKLLAGMEQEFVSAAEAMPEDKYNFAPPATLGEFKDVRTFASQVKHVAQSNYYFFAGADYTDAGDKAWSASVEKATTKADIVKALKDSFAKAHALSDGMTAENAFVMTTHGTRAGMMAFGLAHMMDHYGQIVEYLRMNSIVPPASRGGNM